MVAKKISKGRINAKSNKEITEKSNAMDHAQDQHKHGTKGNGKGKGNDNMEDNVNKKGFPEEGPQGLV